MSAARRSAQDKATIRLVAGALCISLLAFTALVAMDVFFSYVKPVDGRGTTHLPTEVWMVLSTLIGVMGGYIGGGGRIGHQPSDSAPELAAIDHTPEPEPASQILPPGW